MESELNVSLLLLFRWQESEDDLNQYVHEDELNQFFIYLCCYFCGAKPEMIIALCYHFSLLGSIWSWPKTEQKRPKTEYRKTEKTEGNTGSIFRLSKKNLKTRETGPNKRNRPNTQTYMHHILRFLPLVWPQWLKAPVIYSNYDCTLFITCITSCASFHWYSHNDWKHPSSIIIMIVHFLE
jgi:hypothetical protein